MAEKIPQAFIDDLLARVDIVSIIESRISLKKAGREYKACCPFHQEKTPSFTVSPQKQFYHCFGCGAHGTAISFLMDYEHLGFVESVEELARSVGLKVPKPQQGSNVQHKGTDVQTLIAMLEKVNKIYQRELRSNAQKDAAVNYLKSRGLDGKIAAEFEIGFAPEGWDTLQAHLGNEPATTRALIETGMLIEKGPQKAYDRFRNRIMFPIRDKRGRIIGFGGRIMDKGEPKYLNSPETVLFQKGHELYGLYQARKSLREIPRLFVVEGYMDVVSLAQHGVRNVVATLGTALTEHHLKSLFQITSEVIVCFDGDRAGQQAAWRALETALPHLRDGVQLKFMFLPQGEDPDTLVRRQGSEGFQQLANEALPAPEYLLAELLNSNDLQDLNGQAKLVENARPLLEKIPENTLKSLIVQRLSEKVQIPLKELMLQFGVTPVGINNTSNKRKLAKTASRLPPTIVRQAISMLLIQPELSQEYDDWHQLDELRSPGVPLLLELLEFTRTKPHISTGLILEHWRDKPNGDVLAQMAKLDHPLDEEGIRNEFLDAMKNLSKQLMEQQTEHLLAKSKRTALSQSEKHLLKDLLSHRHYS